MFLSIGRSLRRGFSFRFGFRLKGWTGAIMACMMGMFYLCWWCMLGTLYLIYGVCYVCLYLPFKWISGAVKKAPKPATVKSTPVRSTSSSGAYVFLTTKGKKFHYDPCCSSIANAKTVRMDLHKARRAGYTACGKCCYSYLHEEKPEA